MERLCNKCGGRCPERYDRRLVLAWCGYAPQGVRDEQADIIEKNGGRTNGRKKEKDDR